MAFDLKKVTKHFSEQSLLHEFPTSQWRKVGVDAMGR